MDALDIDPSALLPSDRSSFFFFFMIIVSRDRDSITI